jgi:hypothetical protein
LSSKSLGDRVKVKCLGLQVRRRSVQGRRTAPHGGSQGVRHDGVGSVGALRSHAGPRHYLFPKGLSDLTRGRVCVCVCDGRDTPQTGHSRRRNSTQAAATATAAARAQPTLISRRTATTELCPHAPRRTLSLHPCPVLRVSHHRRSGRLRRCSSPRMTFAVLSRSNGIGVSTTLTALLTLDSCR